MSCIKRFFLLNIRYLIIPIIFICSNLYQLDKVNTTWLDDTMYAAPAYYLAYKGHACYCFERGIDHFGEAAYRTPPLYIWLIAGWYKIVGFSVFKTRFLYLLAGALVLLLVQLWFLKLLSYFPDIPKKTAKWLPHVGALLIGSDFLWASPIRYGRPDHISAALACAALLVSCKRSDEQNISYKRIILAGILCGMAVLCHPVNIAIGIGVLVQIWAQFEGNTKNFLKRAFIFLLTNILSLTPWAVYIAFDPKAFKEQFLGNVLYHLQGAYVPMPPVISDFFNRYWLYRYQYQPLKLSMLVTGMIFSTYYLIVKRDKRMWPVAAVLPIAILLGIATKKQYYYLVPYLPLYYAMILTVVFLLISKAKPFEIKFAAVLTVITFIWGSGISFVVPMYAAWKDKYARSPKTIEKLLKEAIPTGSTIAGPPHVWFHAIKAGYDYRFSELESPLKNLQKAKLQYRKMIAKEKIDFVLVKGGKRFCLSFPKDRQKYITTIGKKHSRIIKDEPYFYDVIKITPNKKSKAFSKDECSQTQVKDTSEKQPVPQ